MGVFCQEVKTKTSQCCSVQEMLDGDSSVAIEDLHKKMTIQKEVRTSQTLKMKMDPNQNDDATEQLDESSVAISKQNLLAKSGFSLCDSQSRGPMEQTGAFKMIQPTIENEDLQSTIKGKDLALTNSQRDFIKEQYSNMTSENQEQKITFNDNNYNDLRTTEEAVKICFRGGSLNPSDLISKSTNKNHSKQNSLSLISAINMSPEQSQLNLQQLSKYDSEQVRIGIDVHNLFDEQKPDAQEIKLGQEDFQNLLAKNNDASVATDSHKHNFSITMSEYSVFEKGVRNSAVPSVKGDQKREELPLQFNASFEPLPPFNWDAIVVESNKHRIYKPKLYFKNGSCYKGQWHNEQRDGLGVQKWPNSQKYEGQWQQGKASGYGRMTNPQGDVYEGQWENDMANGQGIYVQSGGSKFQGQFENDKQNGFGVEFWPDGAKYRGQYKDGKKHGEGKFIWPDGSTYDGNFHDNEMHGWGKQCWPDGREYHGDWVQGMMEGTGLFQFPDGKRYKGQYRKDQKHGYGVFEWPSGKKYSGYWMHGKQHGRGEQLKNGVKRQGIWDMGKHQKWLTDNIIEADSVKQ